MTVAEALAAFLGDVAALTAIVDTRIYPVIPPTSATLPALTYGRLSGAPVRAMGPASPGLVARFRLTCWSDDYADGDAAAEALKAALEGFSGELGSGSGVEVIACQQEDEQDLYDEDTPRFKRVVDFSFFIEAA